MVPAKNEKRNRYYNAWLPSIFDDFFTDDFFPTRRQFASPAVNIKETDKDYEIQVAAPGMTKDDFRLELNEDNELVIELEKKSENENRNNGKESKDGTWLRREFAYSSYTQSFVVPEDVELDKISAKMEHGVLSISLPKKEVKKVDNGKKHITIL